MMPNDNLIALVRYKVRYEDLKCLHAEVMNHIVA